MRYLFFCKIKQDIHICSRPNDWTEGTDIFSSLFLFLFLFFEFFCLPGLHYAFIKIQNKIQKLRINFEIDLVHAKMAMPD